MYSGRSNTNFCLLYKYVRWRGNIRWLILILNQRTWSIVKRIVERPLEATELVTSKDQSGRWMSKGMPAAVRWWLWWWWWWWWWWRIQAVFSSASAANGLVSHGQGHCTGQYSLSLSLQLRNWPALELD